MSEILRVLIVEDVPTDAELCERKIRLVRSPCEFRRVETREEYLAALESFKPDIIVSDFKLPRFDGLSALKLAQKHAPATPFLIITGSMNEDTAVECMKAGAWDYVIKEHIKRLGPAVLSAMEQKGVREKEQRASEAARESEERYRALFDRSLDCVYIHDFNGNFIDANPAALALLGYNREEILSLNFASLLTEDQLPLVSRTLEELRNTGAQKEISEYRLRHKNGKIIGVETKASVIYHDGKPYAIQGLARDTTERKRTEKALEESNKKLRETIHGIIRALAMTVESRDPYTAGHQIRVSDLACAIATEMALPSDQIEAIYMAGILHDIGKISVPAEILSKPGRLTEHEFSLIKNHPRVAYDILKGIKFPWPLAKIVLQHHERMDGSGYPLGLSGESILLEARILAVADTVEAVSSHRPYRAALGIEAALEIIGQNKKVLYDQKAADACIRLFREKGFKFDSGLERTDFKRYLGISTNFLRSSRSAPLMQSLIGAETRFRR